jgi:capsular polysaccharide transport system permease protein
VTRPLVTQIQVLEAIVLRAIQTRFGGKHVNFVLALCWPLAHIALLLLIYGALGRMAPLGNSATLFFATGLTPYMFFNYPSRFMMTATLANRPLMSFPIVKLMDLVIGAAILETVAGFAVILVTFSVLFCLGENVFPKDPAMALAALGAMWMMAMGWGILWSIIATAVPFVIIISSLFQVLLYITSGILFVPTALPSQVQELLSWNPITQGVNWFRMSYYNGLESEQFPNKIYTLGFGLALIVIGLVIERFVIRKRVT